MKTYAPANTLLADPEAFRDQADREGFLFFHSLLPREPVLHLRREILGICSRHGFLKEGSDPEEAISRPGFVTKEPEDIYLAAYAEIQALESFHALAHRPEILRVLETLFGEEVLVHPRNIGRLIFPNATQFTTPAHQDYVHIQGTENTWTAWIPLGDCPRPLGGLEMLAGSHKAGLQPVHSAYGAGGVGVHTEGIGTDWYGGDFARGDVILFHSLTIHRGVPNETLDRVRVSVDYRYQPLSQPVTEHSLLPHFNRLSWDQLYRNWERKDLQYYWKDLPLKMDPFKAERYRFVDKK